MLNYMQTDQTVIATTEITGDRLGKNQLLFLNFLSMFKKYHLMEMFKQIIGQDNTPVRKQLLQTALFVITRELIDKANTNAAAATVLLPRCSEQQALITKRVTELLPDQKVIGENITVKQTWEQRKAEIRKLAINRFSLPARLKGLRHNDLLDKLLGSERKEREEEEEEERKQQQERDKNKCRWAKKLRLPCGQDCFFRNLHNKQLEAYRFVDKSDRIATLCCDVRSLQQSSLPV